MTLPQPLLRLAALRPRLCLVALCLALWLPGFFALPPADRDESRFAQATKQMLESGDFVRIMNGTVPRNRKPIGIHWLQLGPVAAAQALGLAQENPIWPYRIPSLLGGIAAVLATHSVARSLGAKPPAALAAGAMLAASLLLSTETHIAKTDAALLGATTTAMAVLARAYGGRALGLGRAMLFWLALGLAVLIKGPIAPMVAGLCLLALVWQQRSLAWSAGLRPRLGVVVLLATTAPWFVAIGLATHGAFFHDAVGGDLGRKLAGGEESHGGPPGMHLALLPLLAFPSTLPVLAGLAEAWQRRRERAEAFLLAWLLPGWLVFELVPTKLPHYPLPLYPALMVLAALWLERARPAPRGVLLGRAGLVLASLVLAAGSLALPAVLGWPALDLKAALSLGLPACLAVLQVAWCAWRRQLAASVAAAVLLYAAILQRELPGLSSLWMAPRIVAALRADWPGYTRLGTGLIAVGYAEPSLVFLAGTRTLLLALGKGGADVLAATPHGAALVEAHALPGFEAEAARLHLALHAKAQIDGFNYSRGQASHLTLFTADP